MQGRDESLDFVKFIAIALVIMVHLTAPGFVKFGPQWHAALVYRGISTICVPLFFLATGALLMTRDAPIGSVFRRVKRIAVPAVLWSFVYLMNGTYVEGGHEPNWVLRILTYPAAVHLWFVYTIIGLYLCLPLLSVFYRNSTDGQKLLVLSVWLLGASINPFCYGIFGAAPLGIDFSFMPLYAGYPILGAYLYERWRSASAREMLFASVIAVLSIAATIIGGFATTHAHGAPSMPFLEFSSPTVIVASGSAFIALQGAFDRIRQDIVRRAIGAVSKRTMSIYFIHLLLVNQIFWHFSAAIFSPQAWLTYVLACAGVLIGSMLLTMVIQRLPYLNLMCPD
ncbi:acyltransferase [Paraburkholderia strydomiana]|uniref:acyltransferase n=1 Tax=Paraburkholderia strydomiana TaxID=1245417 RepID=UPI001BEBAB60|nr:acyltransferase family protein [Paraburkholderia strydomiana]MBT2790437.1 acyltransferase family protein [Paraburkholderia strydomiana]